ncbi:MAG: YciI family protein [Anaerolineae bacterium]|nr:YciI family protein [Anaerolineae bacterium]
MKYLLLIYSASEDIARKTANAAPLPISQSASQVGSVLGHIALLPTSAASTLKLHGGRAKISPGPAVNTPEQLCACYLIHCNDLDEAAEWARQVLEPHNIVEIRPVF